MRELIDWFWNFGVKREGKYSVNLAQWLDAVSRLDKRSKAIRENLEKQRACLAVWGPSQTGKSTMISDAIDGEDAGDGSHSALTWSGEEPARFTGNSLLYPQTVIFNPYNGGSDGSGVVTRYILKGDSEVADHRHPVQVILASRTEILLALSIGYLEECRPYNPDGGQVTPVHRVFDQASFERELRQAQAQENALFQTKSHLPSREAVELLQDLADVIEIETRTQSRFRNLAGNWRQLRTNLFSQKELCSNYETAKSLMAQLLWDNTPYINTLFDNLMDMHDRLKQEWGDRPIYASLKVTKLLLDINTYEFCLDATNPPINDLCCQKTDAGILLDTFGDSGDSPLKGLHHFGLLQALIGELQVPLRREALEANGRMDFLHFLEKADFLDFPGVPNRETGSKADEETKVDDQNQNQTRLFTQVLKQGKTLSLIFMHALRLGIDSFIILKRFREYAKNTGVLANGIQTWLQAFDPGWQPGKRAPLKYYLDLTFFAEEAVKAFNGAVRAETMANYTTQIQQLSFATKDNARFFVTTYPKLSAECAFPTDQPEALANAQTLFSTSQTLREATGLSDEDYQHVFHDADGGVNYLFRTIAKEISTERRITLSRKQLDKDCRQLLELVGLHLPPAKDSTLEDEQKLLQENIDSIHKALEEASNTPRLTKVVGSIGDDLKHLMTFPPENLDPIPNRARNLLPEERRHYLERQVGLWYEYQVAHQPSSRHFVNLPGLLGILMNASLRGETFQQLSEFLTRHFGDLSPDQSVISSTTRKFLAVAICNTLFHGSCQRMVTNAGPELMALLFPRDEGAPGKPENLPAYHTIIMPFLNRLEQLLKDNSNPLGRPPQPGDDELAALFAQFQAENA